MIRAWTFCRLAETTRRSASGTTRMSSRGRTIIPPGVAIVTVVATIIIVVKIFANIIFVVRVLSHDTAFSIRTFQFI